MIPTFGIDTFKSTGLVGGAASECVGELVLLNQSDFSLNQEQIRQINGFFARKAEEYAAAGEEPASGVSVTFNFSPFGREIIIQFDGGPALAVE